LEVSSAQDFKNFHASHQETHHVNHASKNSVHLSIAKPSNVSYHFHIIADEANADVAQTAVQITAHQATTDVHHVTGAIAIQAKIEAQITPTIFAHSYQSLVVLSLATSIQFHTIFWYKPKISASAHIRL